MYKIEEMTLEQKIGQMFMCGFEGYDLTEEMTDLLEKHALGSVIFFRRNVQDVQQINRLTAKIQRIAMENNQIPPIIAIDQEGGMMGRLTEGVTYLPGNMALGATGNVEGIYESAKICAKELRLLGINMNIAPCIDVNSNPNNIIIGLRSFSEDPRMVGQMGNAVIKGYQEMDVCATVKHFPGHGDTEVDSHYEAPFINHDKQRLYDVELLPFKMAIEAGTDAIMTAHVVVPAFENNHLPSTLSKSVLTGILRQELNYDGVIISDCLDMNSIANHYSLDQIVLNAVEAGIDILLVSHFPENQFKAMELLAQYVRDGVISEERINQSVSRILKMKQRKKMEQPILEWDQVVSQLHRAEDQKFVQELSDESITLVKDTTRNLPLQRSENVFVVWSELRKEDVDEDVEEIVFSSKYTLGYFMKDHFDQIHEEIISINPNDEDRNKVLARCQSADKIIYASYKSVQNAEQTQLIHDILESYSDKLIVVSLVDPYDLLQYEHIHTYLISYGSHPLAMRSTARLLAGEIKPKGKLPVSLRGEYSLCWGLK